MARVINISWRESFCSGHAVQGWLVKILEHQATTTSETTETPAAQPKIISGKGVQASN
jgi:hypothetical protein